MKQPATRAAAPAASDISAREAQAALLSGYSVEVTSRDVEAVLGTAPQGTEVFVANLPKDGNGRLIEAAARLRRAGLAPVPHIVARKIGDRRELDDLVARLAREAGVDRVLVLGGDREEPAGPFGESLALIESGAFERHGIREVALACYPEGHPRISGPSLDIALRYKLGALVQRGLQARLVSQFTFSPEPILSLARELRTAGIAAPLRVGVAGPAPRTTLIRYAMRCGVGASLRTLTERRHAVGGLFSGETPERLLQAVALALREDPSLGIEGVHFFTFGAPAKSVEWAQSRAK